MIAATADRVLLRVLQMASPTLPIGAYAYSQGLEWAVEAGWVSDQASLSLWLAEQLEHTMAQVDLPLLVRLLDAVERGDADRLETWSAYLLACRETRELRADDCDRGRALARLLRDLDVAAAGPWARRDDVPLATAWAIAAHAWEVPLRSTLLSYAWGWLENQVLAGVKLVPLGQVAGQGLLLALTPLIPDLCDAAIDCDDDQIGATLPDLAIASSLHETQYTRLFRS